MNIALRRVQSLEPLGVAARARQRGAGKQVDELQVELPPMQICRVERPQQSVL